MREELVGTVGGSDTFSATRVASWTRHVAIACAKGIAKRNTYYYSPAYLLACVLVCLPACLPGQGSRVQGSRVQGSKGRRAKGLNRPKRGLWDGWLWSSEFGQLGIFDSARRTSTRPRQTRRPRPRPRPRPRCERKRERRIGPPKVRKPYPEPRHKSTRYS